MAEYTHPTQAQQLELTIKSMISNTNICKPCYVVAVNNDNPLTVNVQCVDKLKVISDNGKEASFVDMPLLKNVPVVFPNAQTNGFALTLPIKAGDTGYLIFADRALGNFKLYGKESAPQQDGSITNAIRSHSLTDAIFIPGLCYNNNGYASYESSGVEMRNKDASHKTTVYDDKVVIQSTDASTITTTDSDITIKHSSATIKLTDSNIVITKGGCTITITDGGIVMTNGGATMGMSGGTTTIDGNFHVNGAISASGNISSSGNISATGTVHGSNI